jgi:hypothetical protein
MRGNRSAAIYRHLCWLSIASTTTAVAGIVQGTVSNVQVGATLEVIQGATPVGTFVVQAGQRYSIELDPGSYSVRCPTGARPTIHALKVPVVQDIKC